MENDNGGLTDSFHTCREEACLSFSTPPSGLTGRCSQKVQVDVGEKNWTLTAQNKLGKVTLYDHADLSRRVRMSAPEAVTVVNVNARNASLQWGWRVKRYYRMSTKCQINLNLGNTITEVFGLGLNGTLLTNLIPNVSYRVKIRCGTTQHFWKWGDWSQIVDFHTKTDVPEALDVWMQRNNNATRIVWRIPLANQSGGEILDYTVALTKASERGQQNTTTVPRTNNFLMLTLDPAEEYTVTVTARNINGSSPPATITIPTPDETRVKTSRIRGTNGAFYVSWRDSPEASCGYIVDWYPVERPWSVDWLKLPPNQTSANITSNLTDGCRYFLSVYACTQGSPVLLENREGYATETKIERKLFTSLKHEQKNLDVEVSWDPIPLRQQTAYIQGYNLSCWNSNKHVVNVSTANPEDTRLTAQGLKVDSYQFVLTAQTAVGECCKETFSVTLNSPTDKMTWLVLSSLGALFLFLFFVTIICYKQWRCIKQKIFPPIPKPVLVNKWMTSPDSLQSPYLLSAQVHPIDIPQLCNKVVPECVTEDGSHWTFSQTPEGYCNQPLQRFTPSHLSADSTRINLPSSSFRGDVQNPSYDLRVWSEDQNSSSEYPLLDASPSSQYKPQACMEIFWPDPGREGSKKCIPCDSAYISLPR
ncbi:Oncostatin-M-specific receptor subunit beta [Oryzias melastigma]|uniref:Oncostatin-M-specific receptor subunit beta n=1 Tax=Oryzias melastigma TaxID=30732 RepID=A0A834EYH0_ORYME|nr:Oncostatin-M-specific receptor subunit beta [Oryzias melastigma]